MKKLLFIVLSLITSSLLTGQIILQEGFESGTFPPIGWDIKYSPTINGAHQTPTPSQIYQKWVAYSDWYPVTMSPNTGSDAACISPFAPDYNWLITDDISLNPNTQDTLKFWLWYKSALPSYFTKLIVMANPSGLGWEKVDSIYETSNYSNLFSSEFKIDISNYTGNTLKLAFVYQGSVANSGYQLTIDDITITESSSTGLDDLVILNNIKTYPNPTTDKLNVSFNSNSNGSGIIKIIDLTGKGVFLKKIDYNVGTNHFTYEMESILKGVYLLNIESDNNSIIKKLITQ